MIFNFVNPENRDRYRDQMQQYFSRLAETYGPIALDKYDTQSARYVLCSHPKYGVIGGLRLLPTAGPKLSDDSLSEAGFALQDDETWEASKSFFYLPKDDPIQTNVKEFDKLCQNYYKTLWDYLLKVCKIQILVTLFPEEEHSDVCHYGNWPFILESPVTNPFSESGDEYILGVLKISQDAEVSLAS